MPLTITSRIVTAVLPCICSAVMMLPLQASAHAEPAAIGVDSVAKSLPKDSSFLGMNFKLDAVKGAPYIMAWGGQSTFGRKGMQANVEPVMAAGLSLGTEKARSSASVPGIRHQHRDGLYVWHGLAADTAATSNAALGLWRFGSEDIEAWGYTGDESTSGVYFVHGSNHGWTFLDITRAPAQPDEQYLTDFGSAMRFGETMRAGIDLRWGMVSLNAAYTWDQVYPRHLFWKWAGSSGIEGIASGLVDAFVKAIGESSPKAVPIMNFVLRNGLAYGFKSLRKANMTWPFGADTPPLNIETYSVGVTVSF